MDQRDLVTRVIAVNDGGGRLWWVAALVGGWQRLAGAGVDDGYTLRCARHVSLVKGRRQGGALSDWAETNKTGGHKIRRYGETM